MASASTVEPTRRDFLFIATGAMAAVGAAAVVWPLISQMSPDASTLAMASTEVDIGSITVGQIVTIKWRGKPVFISHRTPKEIEEAQSVDVATLRDPQPNSARVKKPRMADRDRRLHPSRLHSDGPPGRLRRLVLPLPRFGLRHLRPHPQRPGAAQSAGAGYSFLTDTKVKIG